MIGSAESTPMTTPPMSAGWVYCGLVVVLTAKMGDQLFAFEVPQRVLQLHQLNEQIVLGVESRRVNRTLEIEGQPLLNPVHARAAGEIQKQRDVQHNRRREDAVATEKIDLQLHRITEPPD